jgi:hypothetical protein
MARPKFVPTDEQRRTVKALSAFGIKQEAITRVLHLRSPKTLRKHFKEELVLGDIEGVAKVAQTHHQMASSGKHPTVTMDFMKTRQRWLEAQASENKPTAVRDFVVILDKDKDKDKDKDEDKEEDKDKDKDKKAA